MLLLILISLAKALFHLTSSKSEDGAAMVKALAWRIGLSVALFVLLIVRLLQRVDRSAARGAGLQPIDEDKQAKPNPRRRSASTN